MRNKKENIPDIKKGAEILKSYKVARGELDARISGEMNFWKQRFAAGGENSSSWLFNSVINKHADIIDNIPVCSCLPRERGDERAAEMLSKIIPVIIDRCRFEQTYSDNTWHKLKYGTAIYGVFWNNRLYEGLGDIDICKINIQNIFWEPGIENIQDSRNLFICAAEDIDILASQYGVEREVLVRTAEEIGRTVFGENFDAAERCAVVDWYYKIVTDGGREVLHYCKFAGDLLLYSSENDPACIGGWYDHGRYPVVFDVMYPCEGEVYGYGLTSLARKCQEYIDRLDKNLLDYTEWASKVRFWAKKSLGVNTDDFCDLSKGIVEVEGDIDEEKLRQIEIEQIDSSVIDIKRLKIDELKEITGSRDVTLGSSSGGVTAASAIQLLQEAGAKFSRDGIENSCRAYIEMIELIIELIRQFYSEERSFRIIGEDGGAEFLSFRGAQLLNNEENELSKIPHFDIEISSRKRSPSERGEMNSFAKALYDDGAFRPENAEQTLIMLELMDFDGIGKLKKMIRDMLAANEKGTADD